MPHRWWGIWGSKADTLLATLNAKAPLEPPYPPNRGWGSVLDPTLGGEAAFHALTALKSALEVALGVEHTPNGPFVGGSIAPGPIQNQANAVMTALPSDYPNHLGNGPGWMTQGDSLQPEQDKADELLRRIRDAVDPPGSIGDVVVSWWQLWPRKGLPWNFNFNFISSMPQAGRGEATGGCSCGTRCSCCCCCCRCRCMPKWDLMPWPYLHLRQYLTKKSRLPKELEWLRTGVRSPRRRKR